MMKCLEEDDPVERLVREAISEYRLLGANVELHRRRLSLHQRQGNGVDIDGTGLEPQPGEKQQELAAAAAVFEYFRAASGRKRERPHDVSPR